MTATIEELVARAVQAARRMDKDPDLEGVAHEACLRAVRTYDPAKCDSITAWVVYVTKVDAVGYLRWRKSRREVSIDSIDGSIPDDEVQRRIEDEHEVAPRFRRRARIHAHRGERDQDKLTAPTPPDDKLLVSVADWQLLWEKYVERWNYRAIARKREVTITRAKELVNAAVSRLVQAYFADKGDALAKLRTDGRNGRQSRELVDLVKSMVLDER